MTYLPKTPHTESLTPVVKMRQLKTRERIPIFVAAILHDLGRDAAAHRVGDWAEWTKYSTAIQNHLRTKAEWNKAKHKQKEE